MSERATGAGVQIIDRPKWFYPFDREADRQAFLERGRQELEERNRKLKVEWEKKRERIRQAQRDRNAKAIKDWQSRTVPHDEAERCQMLIDIRSMHGRERQNRRVQIAQDLAAEGFERGAIASYMDVHPDTISRYMQMEVEEPQEDPRIPKVKRMVEQGKSWREIGMEMGMHKDTARRMVDAEYAANRRAAHTENRRIKRAEEAA